MSEPPTWVMWAQKQQAPVCDREYFHFGEERWVRGCFGGNVVQVQLTEDPDGPYWGWLYLNRPGREDPTMVQPHKGMFTMQFPYGPEVEEKAGKGRTVRLTVTEVQP